MKSTKNVTSKHKTAAWPLPWKLWVLSSIHPCHSPSSSTVPAAFQSAPLSLSLKTKVHLYTYKSVMPRPNEKFHSAVFLLVSILHIDIRVDKV